MKRNYQKERKNNIHRQLILLHICCGPCATHVLDVLNQDYQPVGFFFNPNIYPKDEFDQRLKAAKTVCNSYKINLRTPPFHTEKWQALIQSRKSDPEGGRRCELCIRYRLETTAIYAKEASLSGFGTTLSISPHKNTSKINEIGNNISKIHDIKYLSYDFKKNNGFAKSVQKAKDMNLYRQKYCGCQYSRR